MTKINIKPDIQEIKISAIKPYLGNPRDITDEALSGLRSSLEKFGYVDLLIVNKRNMELVAGHQRLKILQAEGVETVLCIMVDIDDMMQQTMNITLNNQAIAGYWTQALIPILEKLRQETPEDYINLRIKELREECQDLEIEQLGNTLYLWHASKRIELILKIFHELNILVHQHIIWKKPATVLTYSIYPWGHEPCLFGWQQGNKPYFKVSQSKIGSVWVVGLLRTGDPESPEYYSDIWEVDWEGKKRNTGLEHPTVKPAEIFAIPMRVHTRPGDICYEPFSGSGSQIIAAERLCRRCFAMELEPVFCDVAIRRWEEFTGRKARIAG